MGRYIKESPMATAVENALTQLKDAAREKKLVAVIGTGVSMALTNGKNPALSWRGLIENGFAYGLTKAKITPSQKAAWNAQLTSDDMDDLLGAAEFMSRKLNAPNGDLYARWLESVFKGATPENAGLVNAIRALQSAEIPLCTLNYDSLLERVTGLGTIDFSETPKVAAWIRREGQGILHLHGSWDYPASCVLGIRDYETTISNDVRDLIQRAMSSFARLLFIGCGDTFADPNFSALIKWLREKIKTAAPQHYALVNAAEEVARHADPSWHGFVEPINYGADRRDLPEFLLKQFPTIAPPKAKRKADVRRSSVSPLRHDKTISEYRAFLNKDCGQMTIEGVRADLDTAQRKFDLERLFVPLKILPTPPDFPPNDPEREQKLLKWQEKNKEPLPFGEVFKKRRHIALLALPGGGKTLLLKRLAVAYANPIRQKYSEDNLPDLDLTPVLIRCREWKDHIQRPLPVLLKNIAAITGQTSLTDLGEALIPLFEKGRILLLVDGLDEIHNDADRTTFVENLEAFMNQYKRTHLVVTSREAGFALVAPSIARFCERWRVAPLQDDAIIALCDHWHRLMTGDTPASVAEADDVAEHLLKSDSLRRLAENPLLLTMLLVVKHGAGRLPPDRVSLYDRAVEVLLDTWNIKGHEPLNLKEAVPQLACVAFELLRKGKQTATEKELLVLLEEAREKVPQIRRYARDTPDKFLKRVELRSSLLVEAGHQLDGTRPVPFYQFRHLTFQEHLAAVAAVEGHYFDYQQGDSVLTPLEPYLKTEEWKEVIPMAAVMARKQAQPLIASLVAQGDSLRQRAEEDARSGEDEWLGELPIPVARLVQCLAEEAEASPETLTTAMKVIALFARGCRSQNDWQALSRGPYGKELLHQAWLLYAPMRWPPGCWLDATLSSLLVHRHSAAYWQSEEGEKEVLRLLRSHSTEEIAFGLLTIVGLSMTRPNPIVSGSLARTALVNEVESQLFHDDPAVWDAATWAWAHFPKHGDLIRPSSSILDRLLFLWLKGDSGTGNCSYAMSRIVGLPRDAWTPILTDDQKNYLRQSLTADLNSTARDKNITCLIIAFYAREVISEEELAEHLTSAEMNFPGDTNFRSMLNEMGAVGQKALQSYEQRERLKRQ
jgi:hypothetical protein